MTSKPVVNFFGHEIFADIVGDGEDPYWASSLWMKETPNTKAWEEKVFRSKPEDSPFSNVGDDIRPYLLCEDPQGLTNAFHPNYGGWIGYSDPAGFALISKHETKWIVSEKMYGDILQSWFTNWERLGKPGYAQLEPFIEYDQIRLKLK